MWKSGSNGGLIKSFCHHKQIYDLPFWLNIVAKIVFHKDVVSDKTLSSYFFIYSLLSLKTGSPLDFQKLVVWITWLYISGLHVRLFIWHLVQRCILQVFSFYHLKDRISFDRSSSHYDVQLSVHPTSEISIPTHPLKAPRLRRHYLNMNFTTFCISQYPGADMIFVKCFTPAHFPKYWNLPEKKRVNHNISDS